MERGISPAKSAARRFRLTPPRVPEHAIQRQIADMLTIEIARPGHVSKAGVVWWSIDHANYAGEVPGVRVGRGIVAGVPDTFILFRGRAHFIELKTPDGVVSDRQTEVASAVLASGGRVAVARDAFEVLVIIDQWQIPRAGRVGGIA